MGMQTITRQRPGVRQTRSRSAVGFLFPGIMAAALFVGVAAATLIKRIPVQPDDTAPPIVTVTTETVAPRPFKTTVNAGGTVFAVDPTEIGSEVSGLRIEALYADEGASVAGGQVLARLNSAILEAQLRREQANLARARANSANLLRTARRYATLRAEGAVSSQDADDRLAAARMAEAEVDQYLAGIGQIRAQIAQTVIRAPDNGLITKRDAELGEISTSGQTMFNMARAHRLELRADVPETDLPGVHRGDLVRVLPAAADLGATHARVRQISPLVDAQSRMGTIYIELPRGTPLKQGMYARAVFDTGLHTGLAVPTRAVLSEEGQKFVFVPDRNLVQKRVIHTGVIAGDFTEALSGVRAGDQIVVSGAGFLHDGDSVRIAAARRP